nr:YjfB family protein [Bacillus sp. m3-13]
MLSIVLSQSQVQHQASIFVMKKAMGDAEQQGKAIKELIHSSVPQPTVASHSHLGKPIDVKL